MPFFFFLVSVKGYKSSDDPGNCTHREGAAEDPQENPHWREKGRGIEHVCVGPSGLVGYNRPEILQKQQQRLRKMVQKSQQAHRVGKNIHQMESTVQKGCDILLNIL